MSEGPGLQPGDVGVIATVSTFGTTFPVARTSDVLGTAKQVDTLVDRDNLEANKRTDGMTCWVRATGELYRLVGGITNADWILEGSIAGSSALVRAYTPGVALNDVVYQALGGLVDRANANAEATGRPLGVVRAIDLPVVGECVVLPLGDAGGFAGLTVGAQYILSTSAGQIVRVDDTGNPIYPNTTPGSGHVIAPVGIAGPGGTTLSVNVGAGITIQM